MRWWTLIVVMVACCTVSGCSKPASTEDETDQVAAPEPAKSNTELVLDAVTGKQAVDNGRKMNTRIQEIQVQREKQMEELEEF